MPILGFPACGISPVEAFQEKLAGVCGIAEALFLVNRFFGIHLHIQNHPKTGLQLLCTLRMLDKLVKPLIEQQLSRVCAPGLKIYDIAHLGAVDPQIRPPFDLQYILFPLILYSAQLFEGFLIFRPRAFGDQFETCILQTGQQKSVIELFHRNCQTLADDTVEKFLIVVLWYLVVEFAAITKALQGKL